MSLSERHFKPIITNLCMEKVPIKKLDDGSQFSCRCNTVDPIK